MCHIMPKDFNFSDLWIFGSLVPGHTKPCKFVYNISQLSCLTTKIYIILQSALIALHRKIDVVLFGLQGEGSRLNNGIQ